MTRILHIVTTMDLGGTETLLMNIYRNIDREKIQFDFLCLNTCDNFFSDEIKELGGRMYSVPFISKAGYFGFKRNMLSFFNNHPEYKIIHTHINDYNGIALEAAKIAGVPVRIVHAHAVYSIRKSIVKGVISSISVNKIEKNATHYFACSEAARDSYFKIEQNREKCIIINNIINTESFIFNPELRNRIRKDNNAENTFVLGQIGRFNSNKNQIFSINIFEKLIEKHPDSQLWFVGDGPTRSQHEEYVKEHSLSDKIKFFGLRKDIPEIMMGMDVLLFPSFREGFGIVAIEAQACGLPVIASDAVPHETELTDIIEYISLNNPDKWLEKLDELYNKGLFDRADKVSIVKEKGYDVLLETNRLQDLYLNLLNN